MELIAENLGCIRGGRRVFSGLAFRAVAGEPLLLRGPNGVGKSTLLRVLAGLLAPSEGTARLGAADLSDRAAFQEHVAYAGHLDAVKPALTVRQNLDLWARLFGTDDDRAATAMDRFGLSAIAGRPAVQCSAGQKRRLGLARLLVSDRPLWLLDEPTVSLDTGSTRVLAGLIESHCESGGLALIATHIDLGLSHAEVLELSPGRPVSGGSVDAFLDGDWA